MTQTAIGKCDKCDLNWEQKLTRVYKKNSNDYHESADRGCNDKNSREQSEFSVKATKPEA